MEKQKQRLIALDIVRGIAVILMIITHIWISFYWDHTNPIGTTLSYIGGFLSFSIFLIVSGFTAGVGHKSLTFSKVLKRSLTILVAYMGLGLVYTLLQKKDIYTLFTAPVYLEEFLLSLALFPLIAFGIIKLSGRLPIIKKFLMHSVGAFLVIIVGLLFVLLGKYTAQFDNSYFLSLFIGSTGFHTFPFVSYFVVYGVGIWLGWSYKLETAKNYGAEATAIILVSAVTSIIALPLEKISFSLQNLDAIRWPPTLFFITSGLAVSASLLYGATLMEKSLNNKFGRALQFIGKRAFFFFVLHLLFIYFVQGVVLAKVAQIPTPSVSPTPTPLSAIGRIAETLTLTYENKEGWPFNGYKAAVIELTAVAKTTQANIEIRPQDIDAFGGGQDITLYAITGDTGVKKLSKNIISINNNNLVLSFNLEPTYKSLVVAFSDEVISPSLTTTLNTIGKRAKVTGTRVARIDKDYVNWMYKPFSMSGKRWYVQGTKEISEQTDFSAYLPVSCDDLDLYLAKLTGEVKITLKETSIPYSTDCSAVVPYEPYLKEYGQAQSRISIPLTVNMKKQKSGKQTLTYLVSMPNINGVEPFVFEFNKYVAVSQPMYVAWTLDWEGIQGYSHLSEITKIREQNPALKVTHMFNPRIWNSSASKTTIDAQIAFVKNSKTKYNDEVALHLHMFTDMLTKAGIEQLPVKGWGNRKDGYDIPLSKFSYEDSKKLFVWAIEEFKKKGLPKPVTFRAGGWMISMDSLRAAKDAGIRVESSSRTAFTTAYFNNEGQVYNGPWKSLVTTQPYWISPSDQNKGVSKASSMGLYEIPNNGGDSWASRTPDVLFSRFKSNYTSEQLSSKRIITYLSHPDFFDTEAPRISVVLNTISTILAGNDDGPVVYTTLYDYYLNYAK